MANALYNAPVDAKWIPQIQDTCRALPCRLFRNYASRGDFFGPRRGETFDGCKDPYGSVDRQKVVKTMHMFIATIRLTPELMRGRAWAAR